MKLQATTEKVTIKWFAVMNTGTDRIKVRNNRGFLHNAWDAVCSCGWESKTGGAIKPRVEEAVSEHKRYVHNYEIVVGA